MVAERLYYNACYLNKCVAQVVRFEEGPKEGEGRVWLNETCFYPTSGGQPNDTGVLGGCEVFDVEKADDEDIIHHVRGKDLAETFKVGSQVAGEIDWDRRFDHMQQHSGQHLLTALLEANYDVQTLSVHIGSDLCTLDLDRVCDDREVLRQWEVMVSDAVFANYPITISYRAPTEEEAKTKHGDIRIISIGGPKGTPLDQNPCCGTHLNSTGQIGPLLFLGTQKVRGGTRLTYAFGKRAIRVMQEHSAALYELNKLLKSPPPKMAATVDQLVKSNKLLSKERAQLNTDLGEAKMQMLYEKAAAASAATEDQNSITITMARESVDDLEAAMAKAATNLPKCVFVACSTKTPYKVIIGSAVGGADETIKKLDKEFEGRGGGSKNLASCSLSSPVTPHHVVTTLLGHDAPITHNA